MSRYYTSYFFFRLPLPTCRLRLTSSQDILLLINKAKNKVSCDTGGLFMLKMDAEGCDLARLEEKDDEDHADLLDVVGDDRGAVFGLDGDGGIFRIGSGREEVDSGGHLAGTRKEEEGLMAGVPRLRKASQEGAGSTKWWNKPWLEEEMLSRPLSRNLTLILRESL